MPCSVVSCKWAGDFAEGGQWALLVPLRRLQEVLCVLQNATCALPSGKPSTYPGPLGPDVEGKQAALLYFLPQTGPERPEL